MKFYFLSPIKITSYKMYHSKIIYRSQAEILSCGFKFKMLLLITILKCHISGNFSLIIILGDIMIKLNVTSLITLKSSLEKRFFKEKKCDISKKE
ncbi:MAG: hypothetical protein C0190_00260 [Thermodesulfobacterium geofontis]|uniref:Uncharacterized protein n=1 Tax=Thermodesulfobacterium geofontis TaxID=1295609 RepID=A0A2N7PQP4_9BACT|nr:MAG: hypothetical protein C0190_00260 [Thermodesulfobacterium geofontis]